MSTNPTAFNEKGITESGRLDEAETGIDLPPAGAIVSKEIPLRPNRIACLRCLFSNTKDREAALIIGVSVFYFLGIALSAFPIILLINKKIAGDPVDPNSESVFVYTTVGFLRPFMNFLTGRYSSGLGDYVGRKPVLVVSMLIFVLSRVIFLGAETPGVFYVAAVISGTFDCYYFSILAWICDLFPDPHDRSKRVGIFVGMSAGFAFVIGVPLGVILALRVSVELPIIITILLALTCTVWIALLPIDDTIGVKSTNISTLTSCSKRTVPRDIKGFFLDYFPIGSGTFALINEAENPLDWLTNFLMHATTGLANLILLQFCLAVYNWSAVEAAAGVLSIGVGLAIFSPLLLHRFSPIPVIFYATIVFTISLIVLAVSGAGLKNSNVLGVIGILLFAVSACWVPAMQSMLTSEYSKEQQGNVSGLLSQENDLSLVLSYVMSLGFSFTIRDDADIYFPGSSWAAAAVLSFFSVCLHYYIHKEKATTLSRRIPVSSTTDDIALTFQAVAMYETECLSVSTTVTDLSQLDVQLAEIEKADSSSGI